MPTVLLIDDDPTLCAVMGNAFVRRGYRALLAHDAAEAMALVEDPEVSLAVLDLRLAEHSGLRLITPLLSCKPLLRIVVLTGYASIATAVDAIKLGACHYLTKPAEVDDIIAAFGEEMAMPDGDAPSKPTSLERAEWEYIQTTLQACEGNVSAAAKRLGLHRRTLQRKLQKRPSGLD
jgi:two-component system response regulator RegA